MLGNHRISARLAHFALAGFALLTASACGGKSDSARAAAKEDVAIGYGTQPRDKTTGAVTTLSDQDVKALRPLSLEELLRGKVAGLQITPRAGGGFTYRIRGVAQLTANQPAPEPLFIVDGIQISTHSLESALSGLVPEDIKQVTVLKDVASTSIYGTRGAGGVILITTKR